MKCPMSAANPHVFDHGLMECDPDCMWRTEVFKNGESRGFACAMAVSNGEQGMRNSSLQIMYGLKLDEGDTETIGAERMTLGEAMAYCLGRNVKKGMDE